MASNLIRTESFIVRRFRKTIFRFKVPSRIHRAACMGNVEKVNRILADGEDVDKRDKKNRTPLHYASAFGHSEVVALLIKNKCNLELFDNYFSGALIKAVEHRHEECVEILLNNGANPNVQDIDGYSPLHCAVFCQTTAIAENLLSHNADMELKNKDGHTPLLLALKHNNQQVAELLIQNKANIHVVDKENRTALMLAAKYEAKHIIKMLFHGGIDGLAEDQSGKRALSYALASGFNVKLILDLTREEYEHTETRETESDDSLFSSAEKPEPDDIKPTSEKGYNKSDIKNVPESKEVCEDFQQSKKDVSQKKCPEDRSVIEETNKASKVLEVNAVKTFKPDENSKNETSIRKSGPVEPRPTSYESNNKSYTKNVSEGKSEVRENFGQSRNDAKYDPGKQENQALLDHTISKSEMEHMVSTFHLRNIIVKSLHGTPPSSPDTKNVRNSKGEGCEDFLQSRNDAKCDPRKKENQGLLDHSISKIEMELVVSTPHVRNIKVKRLHGNPPSSSDTKNIHEGQGEGCENFFQSRSDGKHDHQEQENRGLHSKKNSESEAKHVFSGLPVRHLRVKSLPEMTLSSPDLNNAHEAKGGFESWWQSRSDENHVLKKQEKQALQENINYESEGQHVASSIPVRLINVKSFHGTPPSSDDRNVVEKVKKLPTERDQLQNLYEDAEEDDGHDVDYDDESTEQKESRKTDYECFSLRKFEEHDGPTEKTSNEKKVKKQAHAMEDLNNLNQSSKTASKDFELADPNYEKIMLLIEQHKTSCKDSVSLSKIKAAIISSQRTIEHKKCHCSQCLTLIKKLTKMENEVYGLKMELLEAKKVNSKLEPEKAERSQELSNLRYDLQEEKKKRRNADQFFKKSKNPLREREEKYNKEREIQTQLEICLKTRDMELSTSRNKLIQVFASEETGKDLLHKYQRIEDINSMTRLEIDTIKQENQEREKKYFEDIEIVKGKYDLRKTIKMKVAETLRDNPFQHNEQFSNIKYEITKLKFQPEREKQKRERLETQVKSYHDKLTAASFCSHQSQTSKGYQELAFQGARDKYLHSQTEMNFDNSHLKVKSEVFSQKIKYEIKVGSLQNKVCQIRHALKEMNLALENVQRDLRQVERQMKEMKHTRQSEQTKVNKYYGKQDSPEVRSQLQNENTLVQQLQELYNEIDSKDTVTRIQGEFHDIVENFRVSNKKHNLILDKAIEKLSNRWSYFEERLHQYENEKREKQVGVRLIQRGLASLEVSSDYQLNLEEERDTEFQKKLGQVTSQIFMNI